MRVSGVVDTSGGPLGADDSAPLRHTPEETRIERRPPQLVDLSTFVSSQQNTKLDMLPPHRTIMQVDHPARQEVVVHTSALDRAKGFQWIITPLSIVLAVLALIVSLFFDNELFSLVSLLIFWLTFCVVYVIGWGLTALATPEAVSFYSAKRQWDVIEREQTERWGHYKWQTQRAEPIVSRPWWIEFKPWIIAGAALWTALIVAFAVWG